MGEAVGRTYGFGRVSRETRPSPYSPLHSPSQIPGSAAAAQPRLGVPARSARLSGAGLFLVALACGAGYLWWVDRTAERMHEPRLVVAPPPGELSEEAARLLRSAIVVSALPTPRPTPPRSTP